MGTTRTAVEPLIVPRIMTVEQLHRQFQGQYGDFWQSYTFRDEFIPGFRDCYYCERDGVATAATHRITVNVWGSICEREVCTAHHYMDGKWVEL